jgi:hypothetical protein
MLYSVNIPVLHRVEPVAQTFRIKTVRLLGQRAISVIGDRESVMGETDKNVK